MASKAKNKKAVQALAEIQRCLHAAEATDGVGPLRDTYGDEFGKHWQLALWNELNHIRLTLNNPDEEKTDGDKK